MASSVVDAFSKVTNFIYSLFTTAREVTTTEAKMDIDEPSTAKTGKVASSTAKTGKVASSTAKTGKVASSKDETGKVASSTTEIDKAELGRVNSNLIAEIKIDDSITIKFRIPTDLSFEEGDIFSLDTNQITISEINASDIGYKLSLTQYFRFNANENANGIVIDLIINNTQHRYICVKYDSDGKIHDKTVDAVVYTYANYNEITGRHFAGIVPDPNQRRIRAANKYNYDAQREDYIETHRIPDRIQANKPKLSGEESQYSQVDNTNNAYDQLSIDAKMYDLHRHAVEGLGKIAATRYNANYDAINTLATETTGKSIKAQTKPPQFARKIKLAQATRDLVDAAHDFRVIKNMGNFVAIVSAGDEKFKGELNLKLGGLLSDAGNINVANSHQILKDNIRDLETDLRNTLNFPDIPTERYVSRDYVFAMFVIDMMNTTPQKQIRRNYSESGKQVNIGTFRKYYESLDDAEKDTFDLYVVKIMGNADQRNAPIIALASYDKEYPSIPKKIDLDGCSTGPIKNDEIGNGRITNVYGYLNVSLEGNNKKGFTITIGNSTATILTLTTPPKFTITYDNVANYIMTAFKDKGITFPIRGKSEETNIDKHVTLGDGYNNTDVHLLASLCLKTFCDKLYRTEDGVTHICTTDSYVYADPVIEYLAGNLDSIPTIMRSGDERSTDEQTDELPPDTCELGSMGVSGRGFYIQPGVNSNLYVKTHYKLILEKTLGYAGFLQNLFSKTRCALEEQPPKLPEKIKTIELLQPPGSPNKGEITYVKMENIFFTECGAASLFSNEPNTVGSLIKDMTSYRLINFVLRLISNKPSLYTTEINTNSYDAIINGLFNLEYKKIITNVKDYIAKLKFIMQLQLTDKSKTELLIIQLPDLEELLTISTPSFCYENDDSLIVSKDRPIPEEKSMYWTITKGLVVPDAMVTAQVETPAFKDVIFYSTGIQISGCNQDFQNMVTHNQLIKEYKLSGDKITGPITLELLCKLRNLMIDVDAARQAQVLAKINAQIENIINDFCKTRDLDYIIRIDDKKRAREMPTSASSSETRKIEPKMLFQSNVEMQGHAIPNPSSDILNEDERSPVIPIEKLSSSNKPATKKKRGGGSRRHKKASRKRNGRKMIHRTRKYKHR